MRLSRTKAITRRPLAILDIGSSKICCMIGEADGAGGVRLLGHGIHASEGVRSGEVSDLDFVLNMEKAVTRSQIHVHQVGWLRKKELQEAYGDLDDPCGQF